MQQYLDLLKAIKKNGTQKEPGRPGMPGSLSLFGYQIRHNLSDGFPILTTKKIFWRGVVEELLWFLRGDTNIKYLVDRGVNIWNEDAYNYYLKVSPQKESFLHTVKKFEFEEFVEKIKSTQREFLPEENGYKLGDCGWQYGRVWRNWTFLNFAQDISKNNHSYWSRVDQIRSVINQIKNNPTSRRHIVTAINPEHDNDLALYWCHAMFQFNCRPLSLQDKENWLDSKIHDIENDRIIYGHKWGEYINEQSEHFKCPKYYLDCQLYQRSADVILGVPFNIASYALLTHIIAKLCNMIPGEFIHTFGDVHIYDNHTDAVEEQLIRAPKKLPSLKISNDINMDLLSACDFSDLKNEDFQLEGYDPYPAIKAKLSTGLVK